MITSSKRATRTVFYVPLANQKGSDIGTGERFLLLLDRFLNKAEYRLVVRGRNEDRTGVAKATGKAKDGFRQDIPLRNATYAAVYLHGKTTQRLDIEKIAWYEQRLNDYATELATAGNTKRRCDTLEIEVRRLNEALRTVTAITTPWWSRPRRAIKTWWTNLLSAESLSNLDKKTLAILRVDGVIPAIRYYRQQTGLGLYEAKKYVDDLKEKC